MGIFKYSMTLLKKDYKKSIFFCLTMMIAFAVIFVFFCFISSSALKVDQPVTGGGTWNQVQVPFTQVLALIIICLCCFMIFFANNFYLSKKTYEIGILALSGASSLECTLYVFYQLLVLIIIGLPGGLLIGVGVIPVLNKLIEHQMSNGGQFIALTSNSWLSALSIIVLMIIMVSLFSMGFIRRHDVKEMINIIHICNSLNL